MPDFMSPSLAARLGFHLNRAFCARVNLEVTLAKKVDPGAYIVSDMTSHCQANTSHMATHSRGCHVRGPVSTNGIKPMRMIWKCMIKGIHFKLSCLRFDRCLIEATLRKVAG